MLLARLLNNLLKSFIIRSGKRIQIKTAVLAQLVEHLHGKEKVPGPNPGNGSEEKNRFLKSVFSL